MATTASYFAKTPHSMEVALSSTDGSTLTISRATLLASLAAGPLKEVLTRATDWTVFNLGGARCGEIHLRNLVDRSGGAVSNPILVIFEAATLKVSVGATQIGRFEIRLQHSERY